MTRRVSTERLATITNGDELASEVAYELAFDLRDERLLSARLAAACEAVMWCIREDDPMPAERSAREQCRAALAAWRSAVEGK